MKEVEIVLVVNVFVGVILLLLACSMLVELSVAALQPVLEKITDTTGWNGSLEIFVGMVIGVLLALWVDFDLFAIIFGVEDAPIGTILTGAIIGRGATWLLAAASRLPHSVSAGTKSFDEDNDQ